MTIASISWRIIWKNFIAGSKKVQTAIATLFGRALTVGRGWMHIAIVMALFVTIFIRKSRRSRTQAVGSEKQAIITVLKNRYWLIVKKYKKEAGKKVPFLIWVKRKAERRRSICDWLCPAFLNAVLLNWFIQDRTQNYRQTVFGYFHHGRRSSVFSIWDRFFPSLFPAGHK